MYNVLIIDDEKIVRIGLQTLIEWEQYGCKVVGVAQDGVQALEIIKRQAIHIVLTDLKMPNMDGLTLVKHLKEESFEGGIVILTNYGEFELAREALRYGVKDYLLKATLRAEELEDTIKRITKELVRLIGIEEKGDFEKQWEKKQWYFEALFREDTENSNRMLEQIHEFIWIKPLIRGDGFESKKHLEDYQEAFINIVREVTSFHEKVHCVGKEEGVFVFFEQGVYGKEQLLKLGIRIQTHIRLYTALEVICIIGEPFCAKEQFCLHLKACMAASEYVFYEGIDAPLFQTIGSKSRDYIRVEDRLFLQCVSQSLKAHKEQEVLEALGHFLGDFKTMGLPVKVAWSWIDEFIEWLMMNYRMYCGQHKETLDKLLKQYRTSILLAEVEEVLGQMIHLLCGVTRHLESISFREEVAMIQKYIKQNSHRKITLSDVAAQVNMNESYVSRLFKQETGMNLINYISQIKMERAKELLADPNRRVKEVANELGFEEQSYFNRMFKKYFGLNPNEYKKWKNKSIVFVGGLCLIASSLIGCTPTTYKEIEKTEKQVLKVAVFQGAYGNDYWNEIGRRFEQKYPDVDVQIQANPEIGEMIRPQLLAGGGPDFIYLPSSNNSGIAQALIKERGLVDLSDVFTEELREKMLPGFLEPSVTSPYGDGKIYLAPLYYSATGLFYNADLFEKEGWQVPVTWDDFFVLGEKAKEKGRALFTYQGLYPGYMEALLMPAMVSAVGLENFKKATSYEEGAWHQQGIVDAMQMIEKIGTSGYLMDGSVALDHTQAQSLWLMGRALFIPCGSWLEREMKDAPKETGFKWGFTSAPVFQEGQDRYVFTAVEEMYIPVDSSQIALAKTFLAFQYTDEAIALNAQLAHGIPPIMGAAEHLKPYVEDATYATYKVFEKGYKPCMPRFAPVENTEVLPYKELYDQITGVMTGELTAKAWANHMELISEDVRNHTVKR